MIYVIERYDREKREWLTHGWWGVAYKTRKAAEKDRKVFKSLERLDSMGYVTRLRVARYERLVR